MEEGVKNMEKKILLVVANILEKNNKILLVQEKKKQVKGKWNLPAGRIEKNEGLINCLKRETKEETGFEIKPLYLIGIYHYPQHSAMIFIFKSKILKGKLIFPPAEIIDAKWCSISEIRNLGKRNRLIASYILESIKDYKTKRKVPLKFIKTLK